MNKCAIDNAVSNPCVGEANETKHSCTALHHVVIMCALFNKQLTLSLDSISALLLINNWTASILFLEAATCNGVHLSYKK